MYQIVITHYMLYTLEFITGLRPMPKNLQQYALFQFHVTIFHYKSQLTLDIGRNKLYYIL